MISTCQNIYEGATLAGTDCEYSGPFVVEVSPDWFALYVVLVFGFLAVLILRRR